MLTEWMMNELKWSCFSFITPLPENPSVSDCFTLLPCPTDASCIPQAHSCCGPPLPLYSNVLDSLDVWVLNSKSLAIAHPAREACRTCYSQGFCRVTGFWTCNVPSGISVTMATMQLLMPLTTMTLFLVLYSLTGIAPNTWCIFSHLIFQPLYEQSVIIVPIFQKRKPRLRGVCWLAQGQKISQRKGRKG